MPNLLLISDCSFFPHLDGGSGWLAAWKQLEKLIEWKLGSNNDGCAHIPCINFLQPRFVRFDPRSMDWLSACTHYYPNLFHIKVVSTSTWFEIDTWSSQSMYPCHIFDLLLKFNKFPFVIDNRVFPFNMWQSTIYFSHNGTTWSSINWSFSYLNHYSR